MPPPSRDRLSRPIDISTMYRGAARTVDLKVDEPGLRWTGLSGDSTRNSPSRGVRRIRRNSRRTFFSGPENRTPGRAVRSGRGRGSRGRVLPHWYPRTPLRDITAIVRAIERRRAELHQTDQGTEAPQEETNAPSSSSSSTSSAQLEHKSAGASDPLPTLPAESQLTPNTQIGKILANVPDEKGGNSNVITPQKRLLESIDEVRDVLVERRRKIEKTPAAKKAEREKKVRTLMSMR